MHEDLIFDVGMHTGNDTEFYLLKGFRVVAVEADPALAAQAEKRFASHIAGGRLTILNVAIQDHDGETTFYANRVNQDWGTLSNAFVRRNEDEYGSRHETITVACTRFENIVREHGVPYYLKVDIEGLDALCLEGLLPFDDRPAYLSIETSLTSFDDFRKEIGLMSQLGYRQFKIVNQALNENVRCPDPALEGHYVDRHFDTLSSGPFGEETPGPWLSERETTMRYRRILRWHTWFGWYGVFNRTLAQRVFNRLTRSNPLGWYDVHAKHTRA